jgi:hypothetical protein
MSSRVLSSSTFAFCSPEERQTALQPTRARPRLNKQVCGSDHDGRISPAITQVAKGSEVPIEAKYEMEDVKLMLSVYTFAKGLDTSAEDNSFNEYGGKADLWAYLKQFGTDRKMK